MTSPHRLPLWKCFLVAGRGIAVACREQRNLQIHLVAAIAVNLLAAGLQLGLLDWVLLWIAISNVLAVELLNTAIETVVDLACPAQHELAGKAKDIAAGAVLMTTLIAAGIGLAVLGPPLLHTLWR